MSKKSTCIPAFPHSRIPAFLHSCIPALFALFALFAFLPLSAASQTREAVTLDSGWKFARGQHDSAFHVRYDDSQWQAVTVPHDWAITGPFIPGGDGNTGKLPWKGEGWYRKTLNIPAK